MNKTIAIVVGAVILLTMLLISMTYTVSFHEVGIQTRFGKTSESSVIRDAGLHFRLPFFADAVTTLDTRLQILETPLENHQTADDQQIVVKAYLLWRVSSDGDGPLHFIESFGSIAEASLHMSADFRDAVSVVSEYTFDQLLGEGSRLNDVEARVLERMSTVANLGVEPISVGFSQIVLPTNTSAAVLRRMQANRESLAEDVLARGRAEAEQIRAAGMIRADKIRAFAEQRASEIRASGERLAEQYLRKMGEDQELAIYLTWLDTLDKALSQNTTLVLETDMEPFHLLNLRSPAGKNGIPMPASSVDEGSE